MAEKLEDITKAFDDVNRYEYGNVAYRALSKKDIGTSTGALKQLAKNFGKGDEYEGFIDWTLSSKEGIDYASQTYSKKFKDAISVIPLKDLYEKRYDEILNAYLTKDEDREKVKKVFDEFKDETYGDIIKRISQAKEKLESNTGNFSDDDKREAKKTIKKYSEIGYALNLLEDATYEKLRPKATEGGLKMAFEDYVEKLTEKE